MQKQTKQSTPFTAKEVLVAKYLYKAPSKTYQFKTSPTAYYVNKDGSVSSKWELDYFK